MLMINIMCASVSSTNSLYIYNLTIHYAVMTGVSGRLVNYTEFSGIKIRSSEDEII